MTATSAGTLRVRVLNVGQGDAVVVFLPESPRALVVDAFESERVLRALEENAIAEIVLFLSHSDKDHVDGVQYLLDNFRGRVVAFLYNRDRLNAVLGGRYVELLRSLARATREQATRNESVWSSDFNTNLNADARFCWLVTAPVSLDVLHPTHDEQSSLLGTSTNEASGVLRIAFTFSDGTTRSVLLTGDVQLTGVSCLLHRFHNFGDRLRADVLKFPHHGAWPANYPAINQFPGVEKRTLTKFLEAVDPKIVILSVGMENKHGHVRKEAFEALLALRRHHLRLTRLVCTQITPTCLRSPKRSGPPACGGDVEIRIGDGLPDRIEVSPAEPEHLSRILSLTDRDQAACSPLLQGSDNCHEGAPRGDE